MMFHVKHIKEIFKIVPRETILKICHSDDRSNFLKYFRFINPPFTFQPFTSHEVSL